MQKGLRIEEVAMSIGVSVQTINRWYQFKREHPEDEVSKRLPEYATDEVRRGKGFMRLWDREDIWKLLEFKQSMKLGRVGKMGKYGGRGTWREKELKEN